MASSMTAKVEGNPFLNECDDFKIICDWTSDAAGGTVSNSVCEAVRTALDASHNEFAPYPTVINAYLTRVETIPGANGDKATTVPTDQYDLTLLDAYGADVVDGALINRSNSVADVSLVLDSPIKLDTDLTITGTSCGNSKTARIILHFSGRP